MIWSDGCGTRFMMLVTRVWEAYCDMVRRVWEACDDMGETGVGGVL